MWKVDDRKASRSLQLDWTWDGLFCTLYSPDCPFFKKNSCNVANLQLKILPFFLWDMNCLPDSCQFYNPGMFFSRMQKKPSFWNIIIKEVGACPSPCGRGGASLWTVPISRCRGTQIDQFPQNVLQYFSSNWTSSPHPCPHGLKLLLPFISVIFHFLSLGTSLEWSLLCHF